MPEVAFIGAESLENLLLPPSSIEVEMSTPSLSPSAGRVDFFIYAESVALWSQLWGGGAAFVREGTEGIYSFSTLCNIIVRL